MVRHQRTCRLKRLDARVRPLLAGALFAQSPHDRELEAHKPPRTLPQGVGRKFEHPDVMSEATLGRPALDSSTVHASATVYTPATFSTRTAPLVAVSWHE